MFFTDDVVLLVESSLVQIQTIKNFLQVFEMHPRGKVNFSKLMDCFSWDVNEKTKIAITFILGIPITEDFGTFLGILTLHTRKSKY